jgi:hypothetical protein
MIMLSMFRGYLREFLDINYNLLIPDLYLFIIYDFLTISLDSL